MAARGAATAGGRVLVSLEADDRRLPRRPVAPLIGQRHPRHQVLLERAEGIERLIRQRIALDVFDAGFGLAFGPRAIRGARTRLHVPIATEREIGRVETTVPVARSRPRTNARALSPSSVRGTPTEMREGRGDALAPIVPPLIEKRFDEEAAGVAEHRDQQKDPDAHPGDRSRFWPKSICS